ncbi:MAG TPA: S1 RNA-binding domain-containing protein [Caldisericia bacterium]|nr:S1 RNA-binding domain-containing protein [Caldisericia bacterium]HPF48181.1 S1 RNA-binding domain-containing protein [Caldisericia bacterium]HPI83883.1 S1 RNA-binding domain-containing protein [Caldisericia bacterium]HPQ92634.1 S1 RNA-binding domain-containing protein [Caldisericia bacterium]HRV74268.1 S1 RNA-binding domain-containing protein [Caldisericia bacterium]
MLHWFEDENVESVNEQVEKVEEVKTETETQSTAEVVKEEAPFGAQGTEEKSESHEMDKVVAQMNQAILDIDMKSVHRGEVMDATVVKVTPDGLLVDVGQKSEGFIPRGEITLQDPTGDMSKEFNIGDVVRCKVMKTGADDGMIFLSKKRADFELIWDRLDDAKDRKEILSTKATKAVKGGLLVDLGVTAFVPRSLIDLRKNTDPKKWVGKEMRVRVIEVDRPTRRVVCSQKDVLEEDKDLRRNEFIKNLQVGEIYEGKVVGLVEFGAFVDLGERVEGLIHLSELTWGSRKTPQEVLKKGEKVNVKLIKIAEDGNRISLSLRQAKPHPWELVPYKYSVGDEVDGIISRLLKFGAIVDLEEGVSGLLHISQITHHRVERVDSEIAEGQTVKCKILEIRVPDRKIRLSMKALTEAPPRPQRKKRVYEMSEEEKYLKEFAQEGGDPSVRFLSESDLERENLDVLEAVDVSNNDVSAEEEQFMNETNTDDNVEQGNSTETPTFQPDDGEKEVE